MEQPFRLGWMLGAAFVLACPAAAYAADCGDWHGRIPETLPAGIESPVEIPVTDSIASRIKGDIGIALRIDGAEPLHLPAQLEPANAWAHRPATVWFLFKAAPEWLGKPVLATIEPASRPASPAYKSRMSNPLLELVTTADAPVLSYWYGAPAPNQKYPLTSFIHPLVGLDGEIITDLNPKDHIHHRGIFWPWVRNEVAGETVGDWWIPNNIRLDPGELSNSDGPIFSSFTARHTWLYGTRSEKPPTPFVEEEIHVRTFPTSRIGRAIDIELSLLALKEQVRIGGQTAAGKGYGGVSIRYNQAEDIKIVADGEPQEKDRNAFHCKWADWSGRFLLQSGAFAEKPSGAAIFVHPSHPDYPPAWITRFYGFLNPSFPSLEMATLPTDQPRRLRYRIWVHRGDCEAGQVRSQFDAYIADWQWKPAETDKHP